MMVGKKGLATGHTIFHDPEQQQVPPAPSWPHDHQETQSSSQVDCFCFFFSGQPLLTHFQFSIFLAYNGVYQDKAPLQVKQTCILLGWRCSLDIDRLYWDENLGDEHSAGWAEFSGIHLCALVCRPGTVTACLVPLCFCKKLIEVQARNKRAVKRV